MSECEIIRGAIDGKKKYCRIPIRSRTAERMQEDGVAELSAEAILDMPREQAAPNPRPRCGRNEQQKVARAVGFQNGFVSCPGVH